MNYAYFVSLVTSLAMHFFGADVKISFTLVVIFLVIGIMYELGLKNETYRED